MAVAAALALVSVGRTEAAPILSFGCDPDCSVVNQGSTFDLVVSISDVPDYVDDNPDHIQVGLTAFSFALAFNSSVIGIKDPAAISYGGFLGPPDTFGALCNDADPNIPCDSPVLFNAFVSSTTGGIGEGPLVRIPFQAVGFGDAGLAFLDPTCVPDDFACEALIPFFFNGNGDRIGVTFAEGGVFVESTVPVPEPATMTLLGLGLLGVARRVRQQRRRGSPRSTN